MGLFNNILGNRNYKWKFIENGNGPEYSLDSTDVETFKKDIYYRESLGVTGIGNYIAIPHGKSDSVTNVGIAIARLNHEIKWETLDGKGVKFVFLFAVSNNNDYARNHMMLLADIAGKLGNDELVEKLLNTTDVKELKELFA